MEEKIAGLVQLFEETGQAHHQAFHETDGADPDWAIWYADYLYDKLPDHLGVQPHRSEIVYLLMHMGHLLAQEAPSAKWPKFYARYLLQRYD